MTKNFKLINTTQSQVYQANERPEYPVIPPFYFTDELFEGPSGVWYPQSDILLTNVYFVARVAGTSDSVISVQIGDDTFVPEGRNVVTLTLAASKLSTSSAISINSALPPTLGRYQWIRLHCDTAGGVKDVTVQIYGKYI